MERVEVELAGRSYPILIAEDLIGEAGRLIEQAIGRRRMIVVSDETVAALHLAALTRALDSAGLDFTTVTVPAGEASKDVQRLPRLLEEILEHGVDRKTVLVAFGGGVVGDLAGFAAAVLLRGIDFVQVPTTLLAQIDSSVGGKTGVNARQGKNLVGAFHQPRLVLADLKLLATLPDRELRAGYAEMVKYGLLGDAVFFDELERSADAVLRLEAGPLGRAVAHCCGMKAAIVAEDEREAGRRALLNLGHTFGHALEAETGFGAALLHGESVALGMVLAAELSVRLGRLGQSDARRIRAHLERAGLPTRLDQVPGHPFRVERLMAAMAHDKKAEGGRLTFILLDAIGRASVVKGLDPEPVRALLAAAGGV